MAQPTLGASGGFEAFLGGVRSNLSSVEQALLRLGSSPADRQLLEELYWHASIIGTAALMMCPTLAQIAQNMVGLLLNILNGRTPLNPSNYALLQGLYLHMQQVIVTLDARDDLCTGNKSAFHSDPGERTVVIESSLFYPSSPISSQKVEYGAEVRDTQTSSRAEKLDAVSQEKGTTPLAIAIIGRYQRQKLTGQLWLSRGSGMAREEGTMIFLQGRILDAQAERRRGPEARNWLSTWERCHYRFVGQAPVEPKGTEKQ